MGRHDSCAAEIGQLRAWLGEQFHEMNEKLGNQQSSLNDIQHKLEELESENYDTHATCEELKKENRALREMVSELNWQYQQMDAYVKKDNLRFYNIPEKQGESTEKTLRSFLERQLKMNTENIEFSVVYRLGPRPENNRNRCIIARFVKRSDVDKVKAGAVKLRGTNYGISEDLPPAWAEKRRQAYQQHVRPARAEKRKVRWRGDRLFIDDREISLNLDQRQHQQTRARSPSPLEHRRRSSTMDSEAGSDTDSVVTTIERPGSRRYSTRSRRQNRN